MPSKRPKENVVAIYCTYFLFAVVLYCGQTVCLVISVLICAILYHNFKTEVRVVNLLYFICSSLSSHTECHMSATQQYNSTSIILLYFHFFKST